MAGGEEQIPKERPAQVAEKPKISQETFKGLVIARTHEIIYKMGGGVGEPQKRQAFAQAMREIKAELGVS